MRLLVCGGRHFDQWTLLRKTLDSVHEDTPISLLIHGGASGADSLGRRWAFHNKIGSVCFEANWRFEGRAAGPIRNQRMIDEGRPDTVVAFPGGNGTVDMVHRATEADIPVVQIT